MIVDKRKEEKDAKEREGEKVCITLNEFMRFH